MGELKKHQPSMTIDEQISNLKEIGLIFEDEEYARKILNDISYFRLIKAFSLNLKPKNGNYNMRTSLRQLLDYICLMQILGNLFFLKLKKLRLM